MNKKSKCQDCYNFECKWHKYGVPLDEWKIENNKYAYKNNIENTYYKGKGLIERIEIESYFVKECPYYKPKNKGYNKVSLSNFYKNIGIQQGYVSRKIIELTNDGFDDEIIKDIIQEEIFEKAKENNIKCKLYFDNIVKIKIGEKFYKLSYLEKKLYRSKKNEETNKYLTKLINYKSLPKDMYIETVSIQEIYANYERDK